MKVLDVLQAENSVGKKPPAAPSHRMVVDQIIIAFERF
jgi:hypothetical protein